MSTNGRSDEAGSGNGAIAKNKEHILSLLDKRASSLKSRSAALRVDKIKRDELETFLDEVKRLVDTMRTQIKQLERIAEPAQDDDDMLHEAKAAVLTEQDFVKTMQRAVKTGKRMIWLLQRDENVSVFVHADDAVLPLVTDIVLSEHEDTAAAPVASVCKVHFIDECADTWEAVRDAFDAKLVTATFECAFAAIDDHVVIDGDEDEDDEELASRRLFPVACLDCDGALDIYRVYAAAELKDKVIDLDAEYARSTSCRNGTVMAWTDAPFYLDVKRAMAEPAPVDEFYHAAPDRLEQARARGATHAVTMRFLVLAAK